MRAAVRGFLRAAVWEGGWLWSARLVRSSSRAANLALWPCGCDPGVIVIEQLGGYNFAYIFIYFRRKATKAPAHVKYAQRIHTFFYEKFTCVAYAFHLCFISS